MKAKEAKERVEEIEDIKTDDEAAHSAEDSLHRDFIIHVAKRKDAIGNIARIILTTDKIDFARWCA